jgi:uncharacterized membrane protein
MAFCANCGAKVGENDKFCGSCGATRVPGAPAGQVPPPPPPPPPPVYQAPPPQVQMPPPVYSQPAAGTSGDSSTGMKANIAGLLCYLGWWVTGIIFLVIEKKSQFVKFHAAQSLVALGAINILAIILNFLPFVWWLGSIVGFLGVVLMFVMMYKAYQGEMYKLPVAGDIAQGIVGKV